MAAAQNKNDIGTAPLEEAADSVTPKKTRKYQRSTIEFPYNDLDNAVGVAKGIERAGGIACALDQLAAALSVTVSGPFRQRIANAKTFGLVDTGAGQVRLSELGRAVVDPAQEAWARAEAFLRVPLFSAIYERYKGYKLPGASGLETEISALGVSSQQADKARQALARSAKQAGFFAHGDDRLVRPAIKGPGTRPISDEAARSEDNNNEGTGGGNGSGGGRGGRQKTERDLHPFIEGLLEKLPEPETTWMIEGRAKWLQAAAHIFDLMYKGTGEIEIKVQRGSDNPLVSPRSD
jgi:hypothetical protein